MTSEQIDDFKSQLLSIENGSSRPENIGPINVIREEMVPLNHFHRYSTFATYRFEQARIRIAMSTLTQLFVEKGVNPDESADKRIGYRYNITIPLEILNQIAGYIFFNIPENRLSVSDMHRGTFNSNYDKALLNKQNLDALCSESNEILDKHRKRVTDKPFKTSHGVGLW